MAEDYYDLTPYYKDSEVTTLKKILVASGGGSGTNLFLDLTSSPTSSTPGINGNYGFFNGIFYFYEDSTWYQIIANAVP